ncbi:MAG: hypothetical protein WC427_00835 [Candidatus Paceibacterota bacterium]
MPSFVLGLIRSRRADGPEAGPEEFSVENYRRANPAEIFLKANPAEIFLKANPAEIFLKANPAEIFLKANPAKILFKSKFFSLIIQIQSHNNGKQKINKFY